MSWRGGIVRDKTDIVFSFLVRERVDWCCERCRKDFRHNIGELHCSHIFGRAKKGVRVNPLNAFAHCQGCHEYLEQHPVDFAEWAKGLMGENRYDKLRLLAGKTTKYSEFDKSIIHKHFLAEKKRMLKMRADGHQGRIDFTMYPASIAA